MFVNDKNPVKSDWYIVKIGGEKMPMRWNKPNEFWAGIDGKAYSPDQIDCWLDDGACLDVIGEARIPEKDI